MRDGDRLDAGASQQRDQAVDRDRSCVVERGRLRQVLVQQPEPAAAVVVEGEDNDPLPGNAAQFLNADPQVACCPTFVVTMSATLLMQLSLQ
ncbi:hypothetical protein [Streptomyces sp. NPDC051677]|uniref:hypothetical protein n=1 Tax=Streptomyces sp. NPDC051677 TaxID=3365669 RepID=UPI0037D809FD